MGRSLDVLGETGMPGLQDGVLQGCNGRIFTLLNKCQF